MIIGTRYGSRDLYDSLIKMPQWKAVIFPAEVEIVSEISKVTGALYAPLRGGMPILFTTEELDALYADQGEYVYSTQYLMCPTVNKDQKFQTAWLTYYNQEAIKNKVLSKICLVDKAKKSSVQKNYDNDYTVVMVLGFDHMKTCFLIDMVLS